MLGFKVSQATVSRYLATVHRSPGQSWRTFIRNQALAFRYRDDLEYSNQDSQSRPDCSYRGDLTRSAWQIAKRQIPAAAGCPSHEASLLPEVVRTRC